VSDLGQTPSQTVGPYFSMRLAAEGENILTTRDDRIVIEGRVTDGAGNHIEDAFLEIWQAAPSGRYDHPDDTRDELELEPGFTGFGRAKSDFETGEYRFETLKPGPVPDPEGAFQAPHISLIIQGRGMLNAVFTRIYFSDEEEANADDLVLRRVPETRRNTLVAQLREGSNPPEYRFDIRMQGDDETVFFDF
jgi:protocatechuate 3,4-dioxygenase alpha subunit